MPRFKTSKEATNPNQYPEPSQFPIEVKQYLDAIGAFAGSDLDWTETEIGKLSPAKKLDSLCAQFPQLRNYALWNGKSVEQVFKAFFCYCRDNGLTEEQINALDKLYSKQLERAKLVAGMSTSEKFKQYRSAVGWKGLAMPGAKDAK